MSMGVEPGFVWVPAEKLRAQCAESFWEGVAQAVDAINCIAPDNMHAQEGPLRRAKKKGKCPTLELGLEIKMPVDPVDDWEAQKYLAEVQRLLEQAADKLLEFVPEYLR